MAKDWFLLSLSNVMKQLANRKSCLKYCCRQPSDRVFQQYRSTAVHPLSCANRQQWVDFRTFAGARCRRQVVETFFRSRRQFHQRQGMLNYEEEGLGL